MPQGEEERRLCCEEFFSTADRKDRSHWRELVRRRVTLTYDHAVAVHSYCMVICGISVMEYCVAAAAQDNAGRWRHESGSTLALTR
jgi:hypothetical protein